jgi:hypothetical protein
MIDPPQPNHPLTAIRRQGVVQDTVNAPTTINVFIGGDLNTLVPCSYLVEYSPTVGDTVVVLENQGDFIIIGALAGLAPQTGFLGQVTGPGSQTDFGTSPILAETLTANVINGRWYRLTAYTIGSWITANGVPTWKILDGSTTGSAELTRLPPCSNTFTFTPGQFVAALGVVFYQATATGSHSWSVLGQASAGALRVSANASWLGVEHISD